MCVCRPSRVGYANQQGTGSTPVKVEDNSYYNQARGIFYIIPPLLKDFRKFGGGKLEK